jgi:hypothetical protein
MLKVLSKLGYLAMVGGLIGLLITRCLLSPSPFIIALRVAAVALMLWARVTFGRRSYHPAANPTGGRLGHHGTLSLHPASDLHCGLPVRFGWSCCPTFH